LTENKILLGFEIPTGEPVYLSLHHLAIFGMTQLSGKTTTLEALISRSGLRAIAFKTKRGETGFTKYNLVTPYYKPRADWQFVEGLVNVALGEKVKYEPGMRYAIMKVCRGRHNLREIQKAAQDLAKETKREFMKAVYEKLVAYLEIVIPELEKWRFSDQLELKEGVNVMDLSGMRLETQHLVIASTIEYAFSYMDHVVVIVPEAWETLPQGKMTPVKWVAQQFIRKGAAIGNYLWLDSQDIGGIDKTPLRQCDNWLMGRMKEAHEVERILKQLLGLKVPKEEIQTLPLGHFYAAIGNQVKKVYVLPAGVPEWAGRNVAMGVVSPEQIRDDYLKPSQVLEEQEEMYKARCLELEKALESERRISKALEQEVLRLKGELDKLPSFEELKRASENEREQRLLLENKIAELQKELEQTKKDREAIQKIKEALQQLLPTPITTGIPTDMPSEVIVGVSQPPLLIKRHKQEPLELVQANLEGRIAIVYAEGKLPEKAFTTTQLNKILEARFGTKEFPGHLTPACNKFVAWGYFEKVQSGTRWDYKVKLSPEDARSKGLLKEVEA